jgi:hypothetical protein
MFHLILHDKLNEYNVKLTLNELNVNWEYNEPELGSETYDCGYDFTLEISPFTCYLDLEAGKFTLFGKDCTEKKRHKLMNLDNFKRTRPAAGGYSLVFDCRYVLTLRDTIKEISEV